MGILPPTPREKFLEDIEKIRSSPRPPPPPRAPRTSPKYTGPRAPKTGGPPAPVPEPESKPKEEVFTKEKFKEHTFKSIQDLIKERETLKKEKEKIDPYETYHVTRPGYKGAQVYAGHQLIKKYEEGIKKYDEAIIHSGKTYKQVSSDEWHPETKIVKTDTGYKTVFPYAGAEQYGYYKKKLQGHGLGGLFATTMTFEDPLGIPSAYETATGQKQAALDRKIRALHSFKTFQKEGPIGFGKYYLSSPMGVIGTSAIAGGVISTGTKFAGGYIAARYGAGSLASFGFKAAQAGVGGAMIGYTVADVEHTFKTAGPSEGLKKATQTGLAFAGGYAGYKMGATGTIRGATAGEWGARRGFETKIVKGIESGYISPTVGSEVLRASRLEFDLRRMLRGVKVPRSEVDFSRVSTLKDYPKTQEFFSKHLLRRKSGIFGSLGEDRPDVHDIDVMYRNLSQAQRETWYAGWKEDIDISKVADIKPWQRTGSLVGRLGTLKQKWVRTPKGYRLMRISESAMRHGESSLELPHIGRSKDIPRSVELYTKLWESGGRSPKVEPILKEYTNVMKSLESHPFVMKPSESRFIYGGKSFGEIWSGLKHKMYRKILLPQYGLQEMSYRKTMGYTPKDIISKTTVTLDDLYTSSGRPFYGLSEFTKYKIKISPYAFFKKEGFVTSRHEFQHMLHPVAPEWMIEGPRITIPYLKSPGFKTIDLPGAENIPHKLIDPFASHISKSMLPPTPTFGYGHYISYSPVISSTTLPYLVKKTYDFKKIKGFKPRFISVQKSMLPYKTSYKPVSPRLVKKSISINIPKSKIPSIKIPSFNYPKPPSSSITKSSSLPSIMPSSTTSKKSSSISPSYISSIPSYYPTSYVPLKSMYGRGRRFYDYSRYGRRYKYRGFKIPTLDKIIGRLGL